MGRSLSVQSNDGITAGGLTPIGGFVEAISTPSIAFKPLGVMLSRAEYPDLSALFPHERDVYVEEQRSSGLTASLTEVAYGAGVFVAVGGQSKFATSSDGATWTPGEFNFAGHEAYGVVYGNGKFVATAYGYGAWSVDGYNWTLSTGFPSSGLGLGRVTFGAGLFIAALNNRAGIITTPDGQSWTERDSMFPTGSVSDVAYGAGIFVAVGNGGPVSTSPDGVTWTCRSPNFGSDSPTSIEFLNDRFFLGFNSGKISTSLDGINWTDPLQLLDSVSVYALGYQWGAYVAGGGNQLAISFDGENWTQRTSSFGNSAIRGVTVGSDRFVVVGGDGKIATLALSTPDAILLDGDPAETRLVRVI